MSAMQESKPLLGSDDEQREHLYPDLVKDAATTDAGNTSNTSTLAANVFFQHTYI